MIFSWLANRRRRRLLAASFPDAWLEHLHRNVKVYPLLSPTEQAKLRDDLRIFVAEKTWEGCRGLTLTDEIKVTIAAQACLLLLGVEHDYFSSVQTILVYPSAYRAPDGEIGPDGVVHEGGGRLGEAWHRGPVVLDWESVRAGGRTHQDGHNVVLHEFAHQLDFLDGYADGTPPLWTPEQYPKWHAVMSAEYDRLVAQTERGEATLLDEYGATNRAEFFAVATECFFEKPAAMQRRHPQLYEVLRDYYCQDPAVWFTRSAGTGEAPRASTGLAPFKPRRRTRPVRKSRTPNADWPGWVRFWMLGWYVSREDARLRVWGMLLTAALCVFLAGVVWLLGSSLPAAAFPDANPRLDVDFWPFRPDQQPARMAVRAIILTFAGILALSALWLRLAIRWVDRRDAWRSSVANWPSDTNDA